MDQLQNDAQMFANFMDKVVAVQNHAKSTNPATFQSLAALFRDAVVAEDASPEPTYDLDSTRDEVMCELDPSWSDIERVDNDPCLHDRVVAAVLDVIPVTPPLLVAFAAFVAFCRQRPKGYRAAVGEDAEEFLAFVHVIRTTARAYFAAVPGL
jgi:hypothetical protein